MFQVLVYCVIVISLYRILHRRKLVGQKVSYFRERGILNLILPCVSGMETSKGILSSSLILLFRVSEFIIIWMCSLYASLYASSG